MGETHFVDGLEGDFESAELHGMSEGSVLSESIRAGALSAGLRFIIHEIRTSLGIECDVGPEPDPFKEAEVLAGRRVVLVDDEIMTLSCFVSDFTAATRGSAVFLPHLGQSLEELVEAVSRAQPEYVLMDFRLAQGLEGPEVVRGLLNRRSDLLCFGFSSDVNVRPNFLEVGAREVILKNTADPRESLLALVEMLG
jgi:CheY-like chemotaxis protein